nr:IS1634 family transposase [Candidatus Sigynarchaeum springense]MDO8117648.1 IS1634 family transposase [Candidatus Sigynarchaeota archaeon]
MVYLFEKTVKSRYGTYVYVCLGEAVWVNGRSKRVKEITLWRKDKQDAGWSSLKQKLAAKDVQVISREYGLVMALLATCKDLNIAGIIDRHVTKRDQGLSIGEYMTILAINRAVALNSKRQVKEWFAKTTLPSQFQASDDTLSPQNIWNQMGYIDQETIRGIETDLCKVVISTLDASPDCFLFDPTNFFTYIREHVKNTIAQRGHNKKKRNDLRQINTSLLVTRDDCNIPLMHETYEGNVPDVSHFKDVLVLMEQRFKAVGLSIPAITLVFDKGNNSEDAYKFLVHKGFHFVSSVRPSMTKVKPLLDVPLADFKELWTKPDGQKVLGYRASTDLYLGIKNTLVVTFDEDTRALQEYNFDKTVTKAIDALADFATNMLNAKPQWKDANEVRTKIDRDIVNTRDLKSLIPYEIKAKGESLQLEWHVDAAARGEAVKEMGKSFIFTNRNEWTTVDIAKTYRAQKGVEDQFKALNDRDSISVMPIYHYTNQKIRVHVFISVLALLISNILYRKLQKHGIEGSKDACFDLLKDIKEIELIYGEDIPSEIHHTRLSPVQQKIAAVLNL